MSMDDVIRLTGDDLRMLAEYVMQAANHPLGTARVCVDAGQVKVKVNGGTWSPPLGERDPECAAARPETRMPDLGILNGAFPSRRMRDWPVH